MLVAPTRHMSLDRDVVGRIREHQLGAIVTRQSRIGGWVESVVAEKAMLVEEPEIADVTDGDLVWVGLGELKAGSETVAVGPSNKRWISTVSNPVSSMSNSTRATP